MFEKVLVANRGEIACRIISTLQRMGIGAVAVWSDADETARHVLNADEAVRIGAAPAASSYLDADALLAAAAATGAEAIHPGYGFLAESAAFARKVEAAGLAFIGPTPDQLEAFGAKHVSRGIAAAAGVPLLPGSDLLVSADDAVQAATAAGYPVVLKATAGGGGIGMRICQDEPEVRDAFDGARRQAAAAFGDDGVYLERYLMQARHVEVQLFGAGDGRVVVLGDRDCSLQRRNQKVVEEAPAPGLPDQLRARIHGVARALGESVQYRSAGTVELLVDVDAEVVAFLEVNARLQVEHPVTESIFGIDLVEWMIRLAAGETSFLDQPRPATGHAVEVRVYAEDPGNDHRPSAGLLTEVRLPATARVDTWVDAGTEVTAHYDPLLAKVIVHGRDRDDAIERLTTALDELRIEGVATNVGLLRSVVADPAFRAGHVSTRLLDGLHDLAPAFEVIAGGMLTTVQDLPGRIGLWPVGVPPSGPMDDRSFRTGNRLVGNEDGAAGLELTAAGPTLRFRSMATICLAGAPVVADLDGDAVPMWEPRDVAAGTTLRLGAIGPPGLRAYLLVRGGIDVAEVLGSRSTFTLGRFGGHGGRALRPGDVLRLGRSSPSAAAQPPDAPPALDATWDIDVLEGPHAAPEFLTPAGFEALLDAPWAVHHNSARTGVRLVGPRPMWARADGGEAGLHPSNIHDTAYAVGAVDLTGDMPIVLGPDGPSLGGFVCPLTVPSTERWKLGQLRPGDTVRFNMGTAARDGGVLDRWEADDAVDRPDVCWRRSGDENVLVEYGPMKIDLALRCRVQALHDRLAELADPGVIETTPGVRSLQVHFDPARVSSSSVLQLLQEIEGDLPSVAAVEVASRVVHLPLSWDDPATREAIARYESTVRDDAPWCPWNIEFIRRINGLASVDDVHRIVFDASYLVLGLGDVYLGAPVATPLDPRHRLVTTKYNPARTWTPENAVGIGGAYLCVYGMEGPGGYQLVGRTVPVWNRFRRTAEFERPWLLRFFDQIRFFPVSAEELLEWRRDLPLGRRGLDTAPATFRLADHRAYLAAEAGSITAFRDGQQAAFLEERTRWAASGELDRAAQAADVPAASDARGAVPPGAVGVEAALQSSVWQVNVEVGQQVTEGDVVAVLEAMKMETRVLAPLAGKVVAVLVRPGQEVEPGQALVAIRP